MKVPDIVLLSTADWDNPFWTNKQHVTQTLNQFGHRVFYIDSLGLRRPSTRDLSRIGGRLIKAVRPPKKISPNLWVWSPIVLPFHGFGPVRYLNRLLLRTGLYLWLKYLGIRRDCLWTYNPMTDDFFDLSSFDYLVYHCVDEIRAQPGMNVTILDDAEKRLSKKSDVVFVTSPLLEKKHREWNPNTHYFPNVADFEHFSKAMEPETRVPDDLAEIPEPRLGFVGAISDYKLDFQLIRKIAALKPEWSIVLIGQAGEGDPWTDTAPLQGFSNLHLMGPRPYDQLPAYLKGFDVVLLPNKINDYTDAMFPMKFFEYLASGRPVVSIELRSIRDYSDVVTVARSPEEFITAVESVLEGIAPPIEDRLSLAKEHTYESRTRKMLTIMAKTRCSDRPAKFSS